MSLRPLALTALLVFTCGVAACSGADEPLDVVGGVTMGRLECHNGEQEHWTTVSDVAPAPVAELPAAVHDRYEEYPPESHQRRTDIGSEVYLELLGQDGEARAAITAVADGETLSVQFVRWCQPAR